jgi:hypothetical protein
MENAYRYFWREENIKTSAFGEVVLKRFTHQSLVYCKNYIGPFLQVSF